MGLKLTDQISSGISVIICCFNSSRRIVETLRHLVVQDVSKNVLWEIILVDNASTDETAILAKKTWDSYNTLIPLIVVTEKKPGLSFAREKGIEEAKYDYLLFCDDDNWLDNNYVQTVFNLMTQNSAISVLGGMGIPEFEITPAKFILANVGPYAVGPQNNIDGFLAPETTLYGAGTTYRRNAIEDLRKRGFEFFLTGRFGSKLTTGEDRELCFALTLAGYKAYYSSKVHFKHFIPAERANIEYYKKLLIGSTKSFPILNAYFVLIQKQFYNRPTYKSSFLWNFFSFQYLQLNSLLKTLLSLDFKNFQFQIYLWIITTTEFMKERKKFNKIVQQLK